MGKGRERRERNKEGMERRGVMRRIEEKKREKGKWGKR
jgi:hypothetical protein